MTGSGALPNLVVIGAMRCGTTALHRYLDQHPDVGMSHPKELNFFFGPAARMNGHRRPDPGWSSHGNLWRGTDWYRAHFDLATPVRGESSPGYTSPDHREAAAEMARLLPDTRIVYLVRDPVERAISQWRHHRADGVEHRPLEDALLHPGSQYLARSRYVDRLTPFLEHYPLEQIHVVVQEELVVDPLATLKRLFRFLEVDPDAWRGSATARMPTVRRHGACLSARAVNRMTAALQPDVERLRALLGRDVPWCL